jgi:prophage tail gpP-like protein
VPDDVVLVTGGGRYSGWTDIRIRHQLSELASSFSVGMTDLWANHSARKIRAGDSVKVLIGDTPVVEGNIDDVRPSYNGKKHSISVVGRSKTADLVDCGHEGQAFTGLAADAIVRQLVKPFGFDVKVETDIGAAFGSQLILSEGERIYQFIKKVAQMRGVLVHTNAANDVVLTRAGAAGRSWESLTLGENVEACNGTFSYRDRYSEIVAVAQQQMSGWVSAEDGALPKSKPARDDVFGDRYRPNVVVLSASADREACDRAAEWHRNTRVARGESAVYVVNNWRQEDGKLWTVNTLVPVMDHWLGIEGDRLISGVQFVLDSQGRRAEIEVVPQAAYDVLPLPEPKQDAWG